MKDQPTYIAVELIEDAASLAAMCAEARSRGTELVCERCCDQAETISGILILKATDTVLALCGPCLQEAPRPVHVV